MALAYGSFHELSHQLRFLLFEIGIGLPQQHIDYYINLAHKESLQRLQQALLQEQLLTMPIASHHIHDLIDQLRAQLKKSMPESQFFSWQSISSQLTESIANQALAHTYKKYWNTRLHSELKHHSSLWSWLSQEQTAYQAFLFLEQWGGGSGAHYHPFYHAKLGYTRREILQYSPEFQARFSIHWGALHQTKTKGTQDDVDFSLLLEQQFPAEYQLWRSKLMLQHLNPDNYYPTPIHPWLWRNQLQTITAPLIDNKSLIVLPHHQKIIPIMTSSIMMSAENSQVQFKLATRAIPPSIDNLESNKNNHYARWFAPLLKKYEHYQNTFYCLKTLSELQATELPIAPMYQEQLSVSLRSAPLSLIKNQQKIVPLASLFCHSPLTNTPLLREIIQSSTLNPVAYFADYCTKILRAPINLLVKHGLAFATEQQHILLIVQDNRPQGLIYKELNRVVMHQPIYLKQHESIHLTKNVPDAVDLETLATFFIQSMLQNNIAHWIKLLHQEYQLQTQHLWSIVKNSWDNLFAEMATERTVERQKLYSLICTAPWNHECLLSKELNPRLQTGYTQHANPFK